MDTIIPNFPNTKETFLELLARCEAYYECPQDAQGHRLGQFIAAQVWDERGLQMLTDAHFELSNAERHGAVLRLFAENVLHLLNCGAYEDLSKRFNECTGFCAMPNDGTALAVCLAGMTSKQYLSPEKRVSTKGHDISPERSTFSFFRHEPQQGESLWIVTGSYECPKKIDELAQRIEKFGAMVTGIICYVDRINTTEHYSSQRPPIPVVAVMHYQPQFRLYLQNDPLITNDVATRGINWSPYMTDLQIKTPAAAV
jgi:hypothetical protein